MSRRSHGFWIPILILMTLVTQSQVLAQTELAVVGTPSNDGPVFGAAPEGQADLSAFRLEIAPGESAVTSLVVSNDGTEPVTLRNYAADVVTAVNGGYAVVPEGSSGLHEAAWLSIQSEPFSLNPGESITQSISVAIPPNTPPGEYMAAIATVTTESAALDGSDSFRQTIRKVNAVVMTVPGEVNAGFEIGIPQLETSASTTTLTVPIENTGNARVKPTGSITITTAAGEHVAEVPVAMGSVYAWDSTIIQASLATAMAEGTYTVTVVLADLETGVSATLPATAVTVVPATSS